MNPRRTRDYRKGTDEHLPTPILGRPHEPILPREFRVSKPETVDVGEVVSSDLRIAPS